MHVQLPPRAPEGRKELWFITATSGTRREPGREAAGHPRSTATAEVPAGDGVVVMACLNESTPVCKRFVLIITR